MAKIEIDDQELKKVICDAFMEMMTNKSTAVVWEEGEPCEDLKEIEISSLRRQIMTYKSIIAEYKRKIAAKDRSFSTSLRRIRDLSECEKENEKLARELDRLNDEIKTYKEVISELTKACNKVKGDIDQELEEAVRGDLMNLKLVRKYLDGVRPTVKTKDEYLKVINFIDKDISNLDKYVEERWGHGEED